MSTTQKVVEFLVPKVPEAHTVHILPDGDSVQLLLYTHLQTGKDYIKCDLCDWALLRAGGNAFDKHRGSTKCRARLQGKERDEAQKRERQRADTALHGLITHLSSHPVTAAPVPAEGRHDLTPRASISNIQSAFESSRDAFVTPVNPVLTPTPSSFGLRERYRAAKSMQPSAEDELPALPPDYRRSPSPEFYDLAEGEEYPDALSLDSLSINYSANPLHQPVSPFPTSDKKPCPGQRVQWTTGPSIWDTYAIQTNNPTRKAVPWKLVSINDDSMIIRARELCTGYLETMIDHAAGVCSHCTKLRTSSQLQQFLTRARDRPKPNTPWVYLNYAQLRELLLSERTRLKERDMKITRLRRRIDRMDTKITDYKRVVMLVGQNRIGGVAKILATCHRNGDSPQYICERLEELISLLPPSALMKVDDKSSFTVMQMETAFLIKSLGGPRLLYALQKAESYPSLSTLRKYKRIPEIVISTGVPSRRDFSSALSNMMGTAGRPILANPAIGWTAMLDGAAIEEILRLHLKLNEVVGLCREHSAGIKTTVDTYEDILAIKDALDEGRCHRGKDGTVLAIAPLSDASDYRASPLLISPSCKSESGDDAAKWVQSFLDTYHEDPNGEQRHGPICILATDGESSFRRLRFNLGMSEKLQPGSKMASILYTLPGLNLWTGKRGLITTADPKHIIKRFATLIRSPTGIHIDRTTLTTNDFLKTLTYMGARSDKQARDLLDPADKQNVPKAVNLIETLHEVAFSNRKSVLDDPAMHHRLQKVTFLTTVFTYFLHPFIKVEMSLSEQIKSLSAYAHLITAMFRRHGNGFIPSALLSDSQSIVKSVIFSVARLQGIDPDYLYYLIQEGTDRLEGIFSHSRTQDHARNFDTLQFAHKMAIGAEVNAILLRYPHLDRGHLCRNLVNVRGVDHVNPRSWKGNVRVGDVDILKEYFAGRDLANDLLLEHFGEKMDFEDIFKSDEIDHLRPRGYYVGAPSRAAPAHDNDVDDEMDQDTEILVGGLSPALSEDPSSLTDGEDMRDNASDADADGDEHPLDDHSNPNAPQSDALNPTPMEPTDSHYLVVNNIRQHKVQLISSILNSSEDLRKVTLRPQRAAGQTIEGTLRKSRFLNYGSEMTASDNKLKSNDLGAVLVRVGGRVCLAVCEILSFKKKSNPKQILSSIKVDELRAAGEQAVTLTVQILVMQPNHRGASEEINTWIWLETYAQITHPSARKPAADSAVTSQKHHMLHVDGVAFYPLSPEVISNSRNVPVWALDHQDLKEILERAWDALEPENDNILVNIERLPNITTSSIPYLDHDKVEQLSFADPTLPPPLADPLSGEAVDPTDTKKRCRLCGKRFELRAMRNHVGLHILRAHCKVADKLLPDVRVGINPCGWCGAEGCKTHLILTKSKTTITSNCVYHYKGMQYGPAARPSRLSPCTNVPLHCQLCPPGTSGQPSTFWKYNFIFHMSAHHVDAQGKSPPLTYEFLRAVHFDSDEADALGVSRRDLDEYRETAGLPASDDFRPPASMWKQREIAPPLRKRGVSDLSTSERDPSPTKVARISTKDSGA